MFTYDTKEKQNGTVDIKDTDPATVKNMIDFLYTGKLNDKEVVYEELVLLADKYQMTALKEYCLSKMAQLMTRGPMDRDGLYQLAEQIQDKNFKNLVDNFLKKRK